MIELNEKTNKDLFSTVMNFFVHNDINFMISMDSVYSTSICDNIKITFSLNTTIMDSPCLALCIIDSENDSQNTYNLKLRDSLVDVLQTIVDIIANRVNSLDDDVILSSDWKMLLHKIIG